jgi:hypothetical protein
VKVKRTRRSERIGQRSLAIVERLRRARLVAFAVVLRQQLDAAGPMAAFKRALPHAIRDRLISRQGMDEGGLSARHEVFAESKFGSPVPTNDPARNVGYDDAVGHLTVDKFEAARQTIRRLFGRNCVYHTTEDEPLR